MNTNRVAPSINEQDANKKKQKKKRRIPKNSHKNIIINKCT